MNDRINAPDDLVRRLARGERLIWWDRPTAASLAKRELNYTTFSGVFMFLFAIFWMTMAFRAPGPFFLFGLLFVGIGLFLGSAPLRAYWAAASMMFALTDRRALVVKGAKTTAYPLERIDFVETESMHDSRGNVLFLNEPMSPLGWAANSGMMMRKGGFIAIADAERVGQEMLALMEQRRASNTQVAGSR